MAKSGGNILGRTAAGAGTGAAIGSVAPGVGTATGAVIGGGFGLLSGLFGGGPGPESFLGPKIASPGDPRFVGIANEQGELGENFSLRQQPRGQFEQMLRQQALQQGPTAATQQQIGQLQSANQGQLAQGISNLAQRGGISSGARERLARASQLQGMLGRQQALAAGEQQKLGLQRSFATQEGGERQFDIQNAIQNQQQLNQFNQDTFRSRMNAFAADQGARAQLGIAQNTGGLFGSGGFLGTGL